MFSKQAATHLKNFLGEILKNDPIITLEFYGENLDRATVEIEGEDYSESIEDSEDLSDFLEIHAREIR